MKVNLGSGSFPLPGYANIDLHSDADVRADFTQISLSGVTEALLAHSLEHISWRRTDEVLARIRSWMEPGGKIVVETPNVTELFRLGSSYPMWQQWIFGEQSHSGEVHLAGFTLETLADAVARAGFEVSAQRAFISGHPARIGYPCIEVTGFVI